MPTGEDRQLFGEVRDQIDEMRSERLARYRRTGRPEHLKPTREELNLHMASFFIQAWTEIWEADDISAGAKLVYLALLTWADRDGYCFPSVPVIAKKAGYSRNTVTKYLEELSSEQVRLVGIYRPEERQAGMHREANHYQLFLAKHRPTLERWKVVSGQSPPQLLDLSARRKRA